jgi:hypothetical protein
MTAIIFYILTIAALTRLAGWGVEADASEFTKKLTEFFSKASCALLVAFTSLAYTGDLFLALIMGAGWLIWRAFGCNDRLNRDYTHLATWLNLAPRLNFPFWFRVSYMGLRGFLSAFPLLIGIALYTSSPSALLLAVPMVLQGVLYFGLKRIMPLRVLDWWPAANEVVLGAFIGVLIVGAL